jgi:hypothetical protein
VVQLLAKLQLALHELHYVLQYIVANNNISYKQLILLFLLHFSVALANSTTSITTTTTMAASADTAP